ncbi:MAG: prepilin-type N-terminal cleavage/methylation domain-containing protein [Planctomycetes bacterium]|nr:prepilin-type N-terminal cleavage/methylation domain-containing protein [Planctomycetota bacterium]
MRSNAPHRDRVGTRVPAWGVAARATRAPRTRHTTNPVRRPQVGTSRAQRGFTLLEILIVVVLLGLILQLVWVNMGAFIPASALDAQANQLRFQLDYLRSEARVQGKPYRLEMDLDKQLYRVVLPPEDKPITTEFESGSGLPLQWRPFEKWVRVDGHGIDGREYYKRGKRVIAFDENGFTADQTIYLTYDQPESRLIWTIHIQGLSGVTEVVRSRDGKRSVRKSLSEGNF